MESAIIKKIKNLQAISRVALFFVLFIPLVMMFSPFATPILMAIFVALAIEPILQKLGPKAKRRKYFVPGLILLLFVFVLLPISFVSIQIVSMLKSMSATSIQNSQFFKSIFDLWGVLQSFALRIVNFFGISVDVIPTKDELFASVNPFILEKARLVISSLPSFGLAVFVFFSFLVLFATNGVLIKKAFVSSNILPREEIDHITQLLKASCYLIVVSILFIGALQALIVSMGSLIFGFNEFFLIFGVTFVASLIPVFGAAPIALLLSVILFINGKTGSSVGMVVVAVLAGTIDNVLKPYIFSGKTKNLHPVVSLFGIIGAILFFGLPGLLLGPLILQIGAELGPSLLRKIMD